MVSRTDLTWVCKRCGYEYQTPIPIIYVTHDCPGHKPKGERPTTEEES